MRPLAAIERDIAGAGGGATGLLALGEEVLEHWLSAHGRKPTDDTREGFRLLALQRQGARGDPSFNACRETCRELVYHHNLIAVTEDADERRRLLGLASRIAMHLYLFVAGKLEDSALGDFCCSSRDSHRTAWQRDNEREP
jgi:hypothetical protein